MINRRHGCGTSNAPRYDAFDIAWMNIEVKVRDASCHTMRGIDD